MKLVPLYDIPGTRNRRAEASARRGYVSRAAAASAASYRIVVAPGCHSRPDFDPPEYGWVLTRASALALSERQTARPDGTPHRRLAVEWRVSL
jgi:hypothetical protein